MKLNNKGFAITGVLYTLFILFMLILVSILSGLSTRKNILEKSVESLVDDYQPSEKNTFGLTTAPSDGKYIFTSGGTTCYTYLKKGTPLTASNLTFTTKNCNDTKNSLNFPGIYYPFSK